MRSDRNGRPLPVSRFVIQSNAPPHWKIEIEAYVTVHRAQASDRDSALLREHRVDGPDALVGVIALKAGVIEQRLVLPHGGPTAGTMTNCPT